MMQQSQLETDVAIWRAQDLGYLFVDDKTRLYKVEKVPEKWELGPEITEIENLILYGLKKRGEKEQDLEDGYFGMWVAGLPTHRVLIAVKKLINERKIITYELTAIDTIKPSKKGLGRGKAPKEIENTYTFYSLWDNAEQQWGRKQFKENTRFK